MRLGTLAIRLWQLYCQASWQQQIPSSLLMVGDLAIAQGAADLAGAARAVASMPEDDLTGVEAPPRAY